MAWTTARICAYAAHGVASAVSPARGSCCARRATRAGCVSSATNKTIHWLGAFRLNFIVTEVVFAVLLLAVILVATWPDPLWAVSCEDFVLPETVIDPA